MKKLMNILLLSCLKATELIEKKLHFKLSFTERIQMSMHKIVCEACSNYEKQNILIEKGISHLDKIKTTNLGVSESRIDLEQFKKSVVDKLNK